MNNDWKTRFIFRFLSWICPHHLFEEIEGDLIQRFNRDQERIGLMRAKRKFYWNAMRFIRPGIILRNKFSPELHQCI
jgi:putative ABC transport system permease protein